MHSAESHEGPKIELLWDQTAFGDDEIRARRGRPRKKAHFEISAGAKPIAIEPNVRELLLALLRPGRRVYLIDGLVLFNSWRKKVAPDDPVNSLQQTAVRLKSTLRKLIDVEVRIRTGGQEEGYWWELATPVASNVGDAYEWLDRMKGRLSGTSAKSAQQDLRRGLEQHLLLLDPGEVAELVLLAGPLSTSNLTSGATEQLRASLYEASVALAAATAQLVCLSHARPKLFGWLQASHFVRSWVSTLGCLAEAINATKQKRSLGQHRLADDELHDFVEVANAYRSFVRAQHSGVTERDPLPRGFRKETGYLEAYFASAAAEAQHEELDTPAQSPERLQAKIASTRCFSALLEDLQPPLRAARLQEADFEELNNVLLEELCDWLLRRPRPLIAHPQLLSIVSSAMCAAVVRNFKGGDSGSMCGAPPEHKQLATAVVSLLDGVSRREDTRRVVDGILTRFGPQRNDPAVAPKRHMFRLDELFPMIKQIDRFFGGRQKQLQVLRDFVASPEGNYFFVTGDSGMGKTALLWRFAQELEDKRVPHAVHFINKLEKQAAEDFCFGNLCERLASFHSTAEHVPDDVWHLRPFYVRLLRKPHDLYPRIVVIIDGLDEALPTWSFDPEMFPAKLDPGVKVIFSARQMADKKWLDDLGLQLPAERIIPLGQLDSDEVTAALRETLIFSDATTKFHEAARVLFEVSKGDPFYLQDLLADLREFGGDVERLKNYPVGHSAYLQRWWRNGCEACPRGTFAELMVFLALAQEPLRREVLLALSANGALRSGEFLVLKEAAARYMVGTKEEGYALSQSRIAEFALNELGKEEVKKYENRLADFCVGWREGLAGAPLAYALRHGPTHLVKAHRYDKVRELLFSFDWMQAKLQAADVSSLVSDCELLKDDDEVRTLQEALRLSAHVLQRDPLQLAGQLKVRLADVSSSAIENLIKTASERRGRPQLRPRHVHLLRLGGPLLRTLEGHEGKILAVAARSQGSCVASSSDDGSVKYWDAVDGKPISSTPCGPLSPGTLAMLPDGEHALMQTQEMEAGQAASVLGLVHLPTGVVIKKFPKYITDVGWDEEFAKLHHRPMRFPCTITAVAVSHDGRWAAAALENKARLIELISLEDGTTVGSLDGHHDRVQAITITREGTYAVSGASDGVMIIWDLSKGTPLHVLEAHSGEITALASTNDGRRVVSASSDHTLKIWDIARGEEVGSLVGHDGPVRSVAITPDGAHAVSASNDHTLRIWNVKTGQHQGTLLGHRSFVTSVAILSDGRRAISGSNDKTLRIWDLRKATSDAVSTKQDRRIARIAVRHDCTQVVSIAHDQRLTFWDAETGEARDTPRNHAIGLAGDASCIASRGDAGSLEIWDPDTGAQRWKLPGNRGLFKRIAFASGNRRAVTVAEYYSLGVWDVPSGVKLHEMEHEGEREISAVAVSPDGKWAVSATHAGPEGMPVMIWDLETGRPACSTLGHGKTRDIWDVAITPDCQQFLTAGGDSTVKLWSLPDGEEIRTFEGHENWVKGVAAMPDGRHFISASYDCTLRVWGISSGREVACFTTDTELTVCAVGRDSRLIAVGDVAGNVHLFELEGVD